MAEKKLIKAADLPEIEFVTTGFNELDKVIKFPRGRVTEIFGLQAVGKTTLTMVSLAGITKSGLNTLFIDVENTFNKEWAQRLGVNLSKLSISNETILEEIVELVREHMKLFDVIVIDSVAAMIPQAEFEGKSGDAVMGVKAKLMNQFLRMITKPLADTKCALIFINQMRENFDMFATKYSTPGGMGLKFAASLRLELKTTAKDRIIKNGKQVGHHVTVEVAKSKVGRPKQSARFEVMY
jgi:recombination protein RecA